MFCTNCGQQASEGHRFCIKCGKSLVEEGVETPDAEISADSLPADGLSVDEVAVPQTEVSDTEQGDEVKPKRVMTPEKKKQVLLIAIGGLLVLGSLAALLIVPPLASSIAKEEEERLSKQRIEEAFDKPVLDKYLPVCEDVEAQINTAVDYERVAQLAAQTVDVFDARKAQQIVNANGMTESSNRAILETAVNSLLDPGFEELMSKEPRAKEAGEGQRESWSAQWRTYVLSSCDLSGSFTEKRDLLGQQDDQINNLVLLAADAPWYPDGWFVSPTSQNVAWTWKDSSFVDCYNCAAWAIDIITQSGCSSVYAELAITQGGTAVDWTNATLGAMSPGQQGVMEFRAYPYRPGSEGRISEINCN